eukprot:1179391-Prorocentrum_minimum.AAC.2
MGDQCFKQTPIIQQHPLVTEGSEPVDEEEKKDVFDFLCFLLWPCHLLASDMSRKPRSKKYVIPEHMKRGHTENTEGGGFEATA